MVDLTRTPLPATGRLDVAVGAGRVELRLPAGLPIDVRADVVGVVTALAGVAGAHRRLSSGRFRTRG